MSGEAALRIAVILSAYDRMSAVVNSATSSAQSRLATFSNRANNLSAKAFETGKQLTTAGMAIAVPLYKAIETATSFETKLVDIRKQMNEDTPTSVKEMTKDIFALSKSLPLATTEIQEMIAAGLRMGIAQDAIIAYTQDVTKMAVAFDMPASEIADSVGKISNVFKIPISKIGDFADAINYLDDNTMAKGPELINVLQRIGGSARALSPNSAAALASTMLSLGESSETSGSGISAMINRLSSAQMQSAKFQKALKSLGIDAAVLQKSMSDKSTSQSAIIQVFERIQKLKPEKQTEALISLFGQEHGPKLMKLANNISEYRRQLSLVGGQEKGSMTNEYQKRIKSSAAQMQLFKNAITELSVKLGTTLLPTLNSILKTVNTWFSKISIFIEKHPVFVTTIMKAAAAASLLAIGGGYLSFVLGGLIKLVSISAYVIGFAIKAFNIFRVTLVALRLIILAFPLVGWIMAIAVAAYFIINNWEKITAFFKRIFSAIKPYFLDMINYIKSAGLIIFKLLTWPFTAVLNFIKVSYQSYTQGGRNIIQSIADGIKSTLHLPIEAVQNMVQKIRNLLPFSPAKSGPLKDLHKIRLVETIAETIKPASLIDAMKRTATSVMNFIAPPPINGNNTSSSNQLTMNVTINLSGSATVKDAEIISDKLKIQFQQLMTNYNNQKTRRNF